MNPDKRRGAGNVKFTDIPINAYNKGIRDERPKFSDADFLRIYRDMAYIREFETMLSKIKTVGEYNGVKHTYPGPGHLSLGQEATAVGQSYHLTKDDFIFGSHRSHGEIIAKSLSCIEKLPDDELMSIMKGFIGGRALKIVEDNIEAASVKDLAIYFILYGTAAEVFARDTGFHLGVGGSMHAFFLPFGIYPNNAIVGASAPIATGAALFKRCNGKSGIVIANIGDGSVGCGPVYESMNFAAMDQLRLLWEDGKRGGLPVIFHINNNGYAMGGQTCGETMASDVTARLGAGVTPNQMHAERVDGFNPLAVIDAYSRKKELLLKGDGPILLDVATYRYSGHSTSDANAYREKEEIDAWMAQDPLITFPRALADAGVAGHDKLEEIRKSAEEAITRVTALACDEKTSPFLSFKNDPRVLERMMFSNGRVAKFDDRAPEVRIPKSECSRVKQIAGKERFAFKDGKPVSKVKAFNYRDAIFEALLDKFYEDPTLISYGEEVREWGGAFAVYRGLHESIPYSRLFNSPISEAAIVGTAVGYGLSGGRVVPEVMYSDFIGRCGDEIFNQLAKWQSMSSGILKMPVVVRISIGARYGAQHSQDWTAFTAHVPGLKVVFPATPWEAKGLLTAALNGTDPVIFFESQRLYDMGEEFFEAGVPRESYEIELGDVNKIRDGSDVTILTVGASLYKAVNAAKILEEKHSLSADIINIHSLVPLRYERILESVKKTGKVVLASEACSRGSFLNDVARNITELAFDYLDAPPVVVGAQNWITPPFEFDADFFPQESWILDAINEKILPLPGHTATVDSYNPVEQLRRAREGV
jgi:2-oxoisovalerate dehydrogenase E1 component